MNPNCRPGTPLVPPDSLTLDVCMRVGDHVVRGTKTVTTSGDTVTVVFRDTAGETVTGAKEVVCPPEVLLANPCPDVKVAHFLIQDGNLILTQTDGTTWSVPMTSLPQLWTNLDGSVSGHVGE